MQSSILLTAVLSVSMVTAQTPSASAVRQASPARVAAPVQPLAQAAPISDHDLAATQEQLIHLLKLSPTLTTVVARDPSLLADQDYVSRNNPQLAQFLAAHPEIARNPEFYLFTHVHREDGSPDEALERAVWPALVPRQESWTADSVIQPITILFAFVAFLGAVIWLARQFLENRRWSRVFKLQSEVHGRLIEKFASNQELSGYMGTDAGKRFLEAAPISVGFESDQRIPNAVARILTPLQIGIVLTLLGTGFFMLRNVRVEMHEAMLILGVMTFMPGIGFIISAGVTWALAGRLGLIPEASVNTPRYNSAHLGSRTSYDRDAQ